MYLVYNERTGYIVARLRDSVRAYSIAIDYTEQYAWVNGDKFDIRIAD